MPSDCLTFYNIETATHTRTHVHIHTIQLHSISIRRQVYMVRGGRKRGRRDGVAWRINRVFTGGKGEERSAPVSISDIHRQTVQK